MTSRQVIASLLACGALALGCGSDPPGVIPPDGSGEDVQGDGGVKADGGDVPAPPGDVQPGMDVVLPPGDAGDDAVMGDATTPPDGPAPDMVVTDTPAMETSVMDAGTDDVGPDAAPDVVVAPDTADDVPTVDVTPPTDACTTGPCPGTARGHRSTSLVSSGEVMRSPSYRMVSTLGQSSIHQSVMQSTGFRLRGGLIGATGGSR